MSTRKSCPLSPEQEDREQKQSEGTPDPERQDCEVELRNKAILQQKRRLKQATQFVHKDSADLLPLDGLTRLGTSKDLVSPLGTLLGVGPHPNSSLSQLGNAARLVKGSQVQQKLKFPSASPRSRFEWKERINPLLFAFIFPCIPIRN